MNGTQEDDLKFDIRPDWADRKARLSTEDKDDIIDTCLSFSMGEHRMREQYDLSVKELEDLLLDADVEKCPGCRIFMDSHAMFNDNGEIDGRCTNCRKYHS